MDLAGFFEIYPKAAVAFSGGTDSSCLLYYAARYAEEVRAYYVKTAFQPRFELDDAVRVAEECGVPLTILDADVLSSDFIASNPPDRCYHCKRLLFGEIRKAAEEDGLTVLLDGTNASDDASDRPGMRALNELGVLSPLRECGLFKEDVRQLAREASLSVSEKPAYACLATRIPAGEPVTAEKLAAAEAAEDLLFRLGFTDFRVRQAGGTAKIQVPADQAGKVIEHREEIWNGLKRYYTGVVLDLEVR